jgi:hypothetical protein
MQERHTTRSRYALKYLWRRDFGICEWGVRFLEIQKVENEGLSFQIRNGAFPPPSPLYSGIHWLRAGGVSVGNSDDLSIDAGNLAWS